jgi:hypothetical protein
VCQAYLADQVLQLQAAAVLRQLLPVQLELAVASLTRKTQLDSVPLVGHLQTHKMLHE